jgi:beta-glucosidase
LSRVWQGDDQRYLKVVATPKHFAVHNGPEATRHELDVTVSKHDLADTYLPAFRALVMDAKADSVMCAYNSVNGEPACADTVLLGEYLRGDWKFGGFVVSDCGAGTDISEHHHFKPTIEEGVTAALKAGTDLFCGSPQERVRKERNAVLNAVHQGILSEADVDRAVTRLLTARFRLGMFDPPTMVPRSGLEASANDSPAHRLLALKTARESIVLLKSDNHLLPLKKAYLRIAVIGPDADSLDSLEGNYNGTPSAPVTILAGIRKRFASSRIEYVQGTGLTGTAVRPVPSAALYTTKAKTVHGLKGECPSEIHIRIGPAQLPKPGGVATSFKMPKSKTLPD